MYNFESDHRVDTEGAVVVDGGENSGLPWGFPSYGMGFGFQSMGIPIENNEYYWFNVVHPKSVQAVKFYIKLISSLMAATSQNDHLIFGLIGCSWRYRARWFEADASVDQLEM